MNKDTVKSMLFAMIIAVAVVLIGTAAADEIKVGADKFKCAKITCSVCGSDNIRRYRQEYRPALVGDYQHRQYRNVFYCYECNREYDMKMADIVLPEKK